MLNVEIKTIPHNQHRYPTVGDYFYNFDAEKIKTIIHVSDMKNESYEFLVSIHEQIEEFLTRLRGISEDSITAFDINFEKNRKDEDFSEPGNDPKAPYFKEHQFATIIEKFIALELGVDWNIYDETICRLDDSPECGS